MFYVLGEFLRGKGKDKEEMSDICAYLMKENWCSGCNDFCPYYETNSSASQCLEYKPTQPKGGLMNCPKCNSAMWDNRTTKRNPKAPDYKCKNKDCDGAIWEKKEAFNKGTFQGSDKQTKEPVKTPTESKDLSIKSMLMSYAKDLAVASMEEGGSYTMEGIIDAYNKMWEAIQK